MLLAEPRDLNLPAGANELNIIRNGKLAPRFSAYEEHERGPIDAERPQASPGCLSLERPLLLKNLNESQADSYGSALKRNRPRGE